MHTNTNPILQWQAPAKVTHERSHKWYLVTGVICATVIMYGIVVGNWALSLIFGLIGGLYMIIRDDSHKVHAISVYEAGIEVDGTLKPWNKWQHFWILGGAGYYELHLASKSSMQPDLVVLLGTTDPYALRDAVGQFLLQVDTQKEKILDAIIRFCKL